MFDKQERYMLGATDFAVARAFIWNSLSFGPCVAGQLLCQTLTGCLNQCIQGLFLCAIQITNNVNAQTLKELKELYDVKNTNMCQILY